MIIPNCKYISTNFRQINFQFGQIFPPHNRVYMCCFTVSSHLFRLYGRIVHIILLRSISRYIYYFDTKRWHRDTTMYALSSPKNDNAKYLNDPYGYREQKRDNFFPVVGFSKFGLLKRIAIQQHLQNFNPRFLIVVC